MTDDAYKEMTLENNKHIDSLTRGLHDITKAIGSTNSKIEDLVEVIHTQNVLAEKLENLDKNIADYSKRMYGEIADIKKKQQDTGCPQLKIERENVNALGNSLDHERVRIDTHEKKLDGMISSATVKWFAAGLAVYIISFGVHVNEELNRLDRLLLSKIEMQGQINKNNSNIHAQFTYTLDKVVERADKCQSSVKDRLSTLEYKTGVQ